MANQQVPAVLVARFLKAHHFTQTLEIFLKEANLSESQSITNAGDWTLEKLVEEKIQFDTSLKFERKDNHAAQGWTRPAPSIPREPKCPISTNVLCITGDSESDKLSITTADHSCHLLGSPSTDDSRLANVKADSPILSTKFIDSGRYLICTSMSGKIVLLDTADHSIVCERRDHLKWVVNLAQSSFEERRIRLVATAGWDQKIHIYTMPGRIDQSSSNDIISPPIHTISTTSNPEALLFVKNPDTNQTYLISTRRDSSFLHYHRIEVSSGASPQVRIVDSGRQNLAPHSNAWVAFTPCSIALHPTDPTLLAIATSHLPHLKVILVRLLFPSGEISQPVNATPATMARASLALQDREDAAITLQVSTQAPQTPYSTPQIAWRPDGSGVWVNGDDGVVRGVEAKTGKVVAFLQAHEAGSKIRTLWAGYLGQGENRKECIVSGGFDRKVFLWDIAATT